MNNQNTCLHMKVPCESAITVVSKCFHNAGMSVLRTFNMRTTQFPQTSCPCPQHGAELCDCQMSVLLVYASIGEPVSLVVHGYEGQTWISVVETPLQSREASLLVAIHQILAQLAKPGPASQPTNRPPEPFAP